MLHVVATDQRRGAEVFASDLVRSLDATTEQEVVVLRPSTAGATVSFAPPIQTAPLGPFLRTPSPLVVAAAVRRWRPDVLLAHGGEPLRAAVLAPGRRPPLVYRRIGGAPAAMRRPARRRWHRSLIRRADAVVAVAEAIRQETLALFDLDPTRVVTIPNGVDPSRVQGGDRSEARSDLGLAHDALVVLSLGSLSWEKDPLAALEASARARAADDSVLHLFVGSGPLCKVLEERASHERAVRVLPSTAEVAGVLAAADLLLFTSRPDGMEGMPATIIEAGLAGRATVAVDVAGVGEVIEHDETGLLVAHASDVGGALAELLGDPARLGALGAAARRRCESQFTIDAVAPRYGELLNRVAGR